MIKNSENVKISKVGVLKGGNGFPLEYQGKNKGKYPFYKVSDMNSQGNETYMIHSNNYVDHYEVDKLNLNIIPKGSIVFAKVGAAVMLERKRILMQDSIIDNNMMALTVDREHNSKYIYFALLNTKLSLLSNTGAMPSINSRSMYNLGLFLPSYEEQNQIEIILTSWELIIEKIGNYIYLEKTRKKLITNKIYSGAISSHVFSNKNKKTLKEYIKEVTNRNRNLDDINVLSVSNTKGFLLQEEQFDRVIASKNRKNYKIIKKGQFAYNPSRINVGSLSYLTEFEKGILSPMYVVFEANQDVNEKYLFHYLKSDMFLNRVPNYTQGSVRDSLSFSSLSNMKIYVPSKREQEIFANILDNIDLHIQKLEELKFIYENQKKGLMQQLLTGKIRVS